MKKTLTALTLALAFLLAPSVASAHLPGQPLGIDPDANSHQWRFEVGDICIEDWTNGVLDDGLMDASVRWSGSSDINLHYRINCTTAGFSVAQTVRVINVNEPANPNMAWAHIWTHGGYLTPGHTLTGAVVELNLSPANVARYAYSWDFRRQVAAHEIGHALGLDHDNPAQCTATGYEFYCRQDSVMAAWNVPTAWDFYRVDKIYPW